MRHGGVALDEARERDVLPGMVEPVRVVAEVVHDVEEQRVVRLLTGVERGELALDEIEQAGEPDVVRVPYRDRLSHGIYPSAGGDRGFDPGQGRSPRGRWRTVP